MTTKPWKRQERRLARKRGGKTRWGSGSGPLKEDVVDAVALAQCKSTRHKSITVHREDLEKVRRHAIAENRLPYMEVLFLDTNPMYNARWYIVHEDEFTKHFPRGDKS